MDCEFFTLVSYCLFNGIIKRDTVTASGGATRRSTSLRRVMTQRLGASILELNGEIIVILCSLDWPFRNLRPKVQEHG